MLHGTGMKPPALTQHNQAGAGKAKAKGRQSLALTQSQLVSCMKGNMKRR